MAAVRTIHLVDAIRYLPLVWRSWIDKNRINSLYERGISANIRYERRYLSRASVARRALRRQEAVLAMSSAALGEEKVRYGSQFRRRDHWRGAQRPRLC